MKKTVKYTVTADGYIRECEVLKLNDNGTAKVRYTATDTEAFRVQSELFNTEEDAQQYIDKTETCEL